MRLHRILLLLVALLPAACGDLPEPFLGNPGATARILAQPPTPRLAVPAPGDALLSDEAATAFSTALANALQNQEVPAIGGPVQPGDWRLGVVAAQGPSGVVPVYTVYDPHGKNMGKAEGSPIATEAWADATPATLGHAATQVAPSIADLLTGIQATLQRADPHSLYNRPAKVQVRPVTGAPGDGDLALTQQLRTLLTQLGDVVQDKAAGADFVVQGQVKVVPIAGGQQRVEIQWIVSTGTGDERGRVVQLNNVPAGTLDGYWGDVATAVAQEAAGGVHEVILRQSGRAPATAASAAGTSVPAAATTAAGPPQGGVKTP